ncbi:tetratricopeptide repeat protein [Streptomyces sp. enrichment culture]|uniref:tetratricopeptide repeat protein n=1 Tax=Streptomyces sp. enrichment culture TaxID=1795815 RepID=UPI003F566778
MTNPLAGLFTARQKEAARRDLYARGVRLCGEYLAARDGRPTVRDARLTRAVGVLVGSLDAPSADPFDALLQVGERALEAGGDDGLALALGVAETATGIRQRSRGAWRLRGRALDGLGRDDEALECYERHLALLRDGEAAEEVTRRIDTLRRRRACLREAAAFLPGPGAAPHDLTGRPTAVAAPEFAARVRARVAERGMGDPAVRRLLELYGTYRRLVERPGMPDPLLGGSTPVGVGGLRKLVAGRTVCLVSNAAEVAGSALGAEIDRYDLVVRCDSFRIQAEGTGERTGLHAVSLRGDAPWDGPAWTRPAGIRLVFGDPAAAWRRATRQRLVSGAQEHVGDASLRRPLNDPALLGEDWDTGTTTAFTVLRLLDFLDVSPRLDLIGFDKPGRLRPREAEWVMDRATHVDDSKMRIALR